MEIFDLILKLIEPLFQLLTAGCRFVNHSMPHGDLCYKSVLYQIVEILIHLGGVQGHILEI
jgi:hypothetical protein